MDKSSLQILCSEIQLKNFRCFKSVTLNFYHPVVIVDGLNGAGKTSLMEALYYACYLRSFRTHLAKELIRFENDSFFLRIKIKNNDNNHEIQVGFSGDKRLVSVDKKTVRLYKELMTHLRVISLIEDDLNIIKGYPQERRSFLDQTLLLLDSSFSLLMRDFKKVVSNRTSLIQQIVAPNDNYFLWTAQLWEKTQKINKQRTHLLALLVEEVNTLVAHHFDNHYAISCHYETKYIKRNQSLEEFLHENSDFFDRERTAGRSLFGAHLDDFTICFKNTKAKRFSSRGEQKLILLLLKIAQARIIASLSGPVIFILDDFITDFDREISHRLLTLLYSLDGQLIFTSPASQSYLDEFTMRMGSQRISLTHSIKEAS